MSALASAVFVLMLGAQEARPPSLRIADTRLAALLAGEVQRSPTLQSVVDRVRGGDVIVFVQTVQWLPRELAGTVTWIGSSAQYRYVRVLIKVQSSGDTLLANLGHELQHVIEVMGADWVTDAASLLGLYRRIGKPTNSSRLAWDTVEAQWTGEQILRELKGQAAGAASANER